MFNGFQSADFEAAVELLRDRYRNDHVANNALTVCINHYATYNGNGDRCAMILLNEFGEIDRSVLMQQARHIARL